MTASSGALRRLGLFSHRGLLAAFAAGSFLTGAHAQQTLANFNFTGAPQTYTVPPGITALLIDVAGGAGGGAGHVVNSSLVNQPGGRGAVLEHAQFAVFPGDIITVDVGAKGVDNLDVAVGSTRPGAYGGGGSGGRSGYVSGAAPGGGATRVSLNGTLILVAGGGGGTGGMDGSFWGAATGGDGGYPTGLAGQPGTVKNASGFVGGGAGGGQTGPGVPANGGVGGNGEDSPSTATGGGGGGGGGGYLGGNGGLRGEHVFMAGSGGGGGSSYVASTVSGTEISTTPNPGNGYVRISIAPDPIQNLTAVPDNGEVTLVWTLASTPSPTTRINVKAVNLANSADSQELDLTGPKLGTITIFNGLTNGQSYSFTVTPFSGTASGIQKTIEGTPAVQPDVLGEIQANLAAANVQVQSLLADNAALTNQNVTLQANVADLTAQNGTLQTSVTALTAQNESLQANVASLTTQNTALQGNVNTLAMQNATLTSALAIADATVQTLQGTVASQANALETLTASLGAAFSDPAFDIPGATTQEQIANLATAIEGLNHGQRQALYEKLGGKK